MMKDLWKFVQEKPPSVNGDGWGWGRWWAQMDGADGDKYPSSCSSLVNITLILLVAKHGC